MKTLIFPSEFMDNSGGVPQSTISMVTGLAISSDFKIIVICPKNSEMSKTKFPNKVKIITTKSSVWKFSKNSLIETIRTIYDIFITLKPYINKNTWIVSNQPVTSSIISFFPYKHIKEIYINRGGDFKDKGIASFIIKKKLKYKIIDYAVGISQRQKELLIKSGLPHNRVFLIHNGLALPKINYTSKNLDSSNLKISTIGFISDLKNQLEGVKLIKLLRDNGINATLNIYGKPDTDNKYQNKLKETIKQLNLESYIFFCGFVSGEDLFSNTDIVISFSRSEGFGRSLVEGMLRYKPVIAWRGSGGPIDITDNGKYGHLVNCNEANEYFNVILSLINNPLYNIKNIEQSYNYAYKNFTIDCMVNQYIELFKKVCKS